MSYLTKEQNTILKNAKAAIRALDHPLRQQLLAQIKKSGNRMMVTQLYKELGLEQSVTSAQLAVLRSKKLVIATREGRAIWYSVDDEAIKDVIKKCAVF